MHIITGSRTDPTEIARDGAQAENMQASKSNPATSLESQCQLTSYSSACIQCAMTVESHNVSVIASFSSQETKVLFGIL